jgi:hypothetical protein
MGRMLRNLPALFVLLVVFIALVALGAFVAKKVWNRS